MSSLWPPDRQPIAMAGRLVPMKGCRLRTIDAVDELRRRGRDVRCRIHGDGSLRTRIEIRIDALGPHDRVPIAGEIPRAESRKARTATRGFVGMDAAIIEGLPRRDERGYDELCTAHRQDAQRFELDFVMDRFLELVDRDPLSAEVPNDGWRFAASSIGLAARSWRNSLQTVRGPKSDDPRSPRR